MAAMGGGMGMRTIWIALRATNYTSRIFQEVIKDLVRLERVEKKVGQAMMARLRMGQAMIMTGMMMTTMGAMMTQGMLNMAMATEKGAVEMGQLKQEMERATIAFADAIYDVLKLSGVLNLLHTVLNAMKKNHLISMIAAATVLLAGAALMAGGAVIFLAGVMNSWAVVSTLVIPLLAKLNIAITLHESYIWGLYLTWKLLLGAVIAGVAIFVVLTQITDRFGKAAGLITSLAVAFIGLAIAIATVKAIASGGTTLLTDIGSMVALGAIGGGLMGAVYAGSKRMGTRGLGQTGLVYAHEGEVIYNPATRRPTQIANELEGEAAGRGATTIYETPVTIENAHLKADFDDLDEAFTKAQRKIMRRSR